MKKILLPTDFSENAFNAVKYAVQLFDKAEATFYLLNTYTPVLYDAEYLSYNSPKLSLENIYERNSQTGLEKVKERIQADFKNPLHKIETISSFNLLNEEIKLQVREKYIDLVVMGTKGATGAVQIMFGTNTVHAIRRAICPILAIPSGFEYKAPQEILFPTDYDINYSRQHLDILIEIASKKKAVIQVLNVTFGYPLNPQQEKAKKILDNYLFEVSNNFYSVEKETVTRGIYHFQQEHNIDMMAMISNKHSFFENLLFRPVVNEISFQLKMPVLVIPSGKFNK